MPTGVSHHSFTSENHLEVLDKMTINISHGDPPDLPTIDKNRRGRMEDRKEGSRLLRFQVSAWSFSDSKDRRKKARESTSDGDPGSPLPSVLVVVFIPVRQRIRQGQINVTLFVTDCRCCVVTCVLTISGDTSVYLSVCLSVLSAGGQKDQHM